MSRNSRWIGLWLLASVACVSTVRAEFTAITGWERQLFPSYIIATASMRAPATPPAGTLGDPTGLLGAAVVAPGDQTPVRVTIECDELFGTSEFAGVLPKKGVAYRILPKVKFRYSELAQVDQAKSISVTFRVKVGANAEEEQTITLLVRSINDCPFSVKLAGGQIETSFTFAAYVNEQHPFVDKLLREALDIGMVDKFTGYQSGDKKEVIRQAYALWDLLVARDVRYSNVTTSAAEADTVASQHVRLLDDTVNNSQANCLDGSVLWVSMLRKIGIDAFLVIEPGHCYAGFFADKEHKTCYAVETTLLGDTIELDSLEVPEEFDAAISEDDRDEGSFASFVSAVKTGTTRFAANAAKFKDAAQPRFRVIDIGSARQHGILPIAFNGRQEFLSVDHSERWVEDSDEENPEGDAEEEDAAEMSDAAEDEEDDTEDSDEEVEDDASESNWSKELK